MKILVVNAGSSTHKCAIFENGKKDPLWTGLLDWGIYRNQVKIVYTTINEKSVEKISPIKPILEIMKELLQSANISDLKVIGHRVVHGGENFQEPVLITKDVIDTIRDLEPLAPLHNPANLEGIEIMRILFPKLPQIAVFDTAFHMQIPEVAYTYAIPSDLRKKGIRRFGFHGISHEYCMRRSLEMMPHLDNPKIITCHLGNGASLAAILGGHSIDTTMGFTPMEGLMMGTRSGSIDPGIILYLLNNQIMTADALDYCLNYESGLKGISIGVSDMREIIKKMNEGDKNAKLGADMFVYSLNGFIGKMVSSLQGLDLLIFTAGIGENSVLVRQMSCDALKHLGVIIDPEKNANCKEDAQISTKESKVTVLVIKTREEYAISEKCLAILREP